MNHNIYAVSKRAPVAQWCLRLCAAALAVLPPTAFSADSANSTTPANVTTPPPQTSGESIVVKGNVAKAAVDAAGNRYITGTFYETGNFNPQGKDEKTPAGGADIYLTKYNVDGSYAWTVSFGAMDADESAFGLSISNGIVYVAGSRYQYQKYWPPVVCPGPQPYPYPEKPPVDDNGQPRPPIDPTVKPPVDQNGNPLPLPPMDPGVKPPYDPNIKPPLDSNGNPLPLPPLPVPPKPPVDGTGQIPVDPIPFPMPFPPPFQYNVTQPILVAFDATTGDLVTTFAEKGVANLPLPGGGQPASVTVSGSSVYVAGTKWPDPNFYPQVCVQVTFLTDDFLKDLNLPLPPVKTDPATGASVRGGDDYGFGPDKPLPIPEPIPDPFPNPKPYPNPQPYPIPDTNHAFVWSVDAVSGLNSATFGAKGLSVLNNVAGDAVAHGVAVTANGVYVTGQTKEVDGQVYILDDLSDDPTANTDPNTKDDTVKPRCPTYQPTTPVAFVAALDLAGQPNWTFGAKGYITYGAGSVVSGNAIAADGGKLYVTGSFAASNLYYPAYDDVGINDDNSANNGDVTKFSMPFYYNPTSPADVFVLALNEKDGSPDAAFGNSGTVYFGRQFDDAGNDIAVSGGTVYVAGAYGNKVTVCGYGPYYPMMLGPDDKPQPAPAQEPAKPVGDAMPFKPIWNWQPPSTSDAFVLALNQADGSVKTSFSADGYETFGGSEQDVGLSVSVSGGNVYLAGAFYSSDAGIGGSGKVNAEGWYGFLVKMDAQTGGGGEIETNSPPTVITDGNIHFDIPENAGDGYGGGGNDDGTVTINDVDKKAACMDNGFHAWLTACVTDDGLPILYTFAPTDNNLSLTFNWTQLEGPTSQIENPNQLGTPVSLSGAGHYVFQIEVSDSDYTVSATLTIDAVINLAPIFVSEPTATPDSVVVGETVTFNAVASDPENTELFYIWDFGDGTQGWGANVTHVYTEGGHYCVWVSANDGINSIGTEVGVTVAKGLEVTGLKYQPYKGKDKRKCGQVIITGTLDSPDDVCCASISLYVGGCSAEFSLDRKGRGKNTFGSIQFSRKKHNYTFTAKISGDVGSYTNTGAVAVYMKVNDHKFHADRNVKKSRNGDMISVK